MTLASTNKKRYQAYQRIICKHTTTILISASEDILVTNTAVWIASNEVSTIKRWI
jgi:hypothetical protein